MTTTLRGDGVLFNNGTLQTTAARTPPVMNTGQWGTGYKASSPDLTWAHTQPPGNVSQAHGATPYTLWQAKILDVANRYTSPVNVTTQRAVDVTYVNDTASPMFVSVNSMNSGDYAGVSIYVNGVLTSMRQGDMDDGGATISAWSIVPPGASYAVDASTSSGRGFSSWVEIRE